MCRILLVFELYTQDRPDRGLPLRFLFSFGEERASKGEFSLISGRGFKNLGAHFARGITTKAYPPLLSTLSYATESSWLSA